MKYRGCAPARCEAGLSRAERQALEILVSAHPDELIAPATPSLKRAVRSLVGKGLAKVTAQEGVRRKLYEITGAGLRAA